MYIWQEKSLYWTVRGSDIKDYKDNSKFITRHFIFSNAFNCRQLSTTMVLWMIINRTKMDMLNNIKQRHKKWTWNSNVYLGQGSGLLFVII